MKIGYIFWLFWIIYALLGFYWGRSIEVNGRTRYYGGNIILLVLLFLVGWEVFGFIAEK